MVRKGLISQGVLLVEGGQLPAVLKPARADFRLHAVQPTVLVHQVHQPVPPLARAQISSRTFSCRLVAPTRPNLKSASTWKPAQLMTSPENSTRHTCTHFFRSTYFHPQQLKHGGNVADMIHPSLS